MEATLGALCFNIGGNKRHFQAKNPWARLGAALNNRKNG
jgi:hypothetical protein